MTKTLKDSLEREKTRKNSQSKHEVKASVHAQNVSAYAENIPERTGNVSTYPTPKCQCEEHKKFWSSNYDSNYQTSSYGTLGHKKSTSSTLEHKKSTNSTFDHKKSTSSTFDHKRSTGSGLKQSKSSNSHSDASEPKKCVKFSDACHTLPSRGKGAKKDTRVRVQNCDNEDLVWL